MTGVTPSVSEEVVFAVDHEAQPRAPRPVVSWLELHARRVPDEVALVDLHRASQHTYATLAGRVRSVAWSLAERFGIEPGDRVALLSRNDTRAFEVVYACALLGAIVVPLNWRLATDELAAVARDAEPAVLVHESAAEPAAAALVEAGSVPRRIPWNSELHEDTDDDRYEVLASAVVPETWSPPVVDDESSWMIIYTSGTTGLPKGVEITHRSALASLLGILVGHEVGAASRCLTVLPLFHVAGLNLFANPVLYAGGTVVVAREFDPARALALLADVSAPITHFCGVPANYQFIEACPDFAATPLRPFVGVVGGAPVPAALLETWAGRGVALSAVFGITEAGACVTATPPGGATGAAGTVGLPLLYARVRIRTTDDEPPGPGEVGELQIAGDVVTPGYWRRPDATAAAFTGDGWLHTGDAAIWSGTGQLVLVDRWKDMYISGGENVYPAEVENVLHAHHGVAQAAVVGATHPRWGEAGVAFVVPTGDALPDEADLITWCRERLARYKVPVRIVFTEELPRNATGKVLKAPLRERARATSSSATSV